MSTKSERRAIRRQNREMRTIQRTARKSKFKAINAAAENANITIDLDQAEPKFADAFNQVWPILKPVLEYAELIKITGPDVDKVIRAVIDLGERVSTGAASEAEKTEFISKLDKVWEPAKTALGIIVTFTGEKVDKVIDKIIEIGDWITEEKDQ